ncbi:hypothetical protein MYX78_08280 [Acidobacteria bacterium AH-259-G07]|nr:hypothetical protein [Acidobacteria bacterium AH-259-G07]
MKFVQLASWILLAAALANAAAVPNKDAAFSIKGLSEREQTLFLEGIGQAVTHYDLKLRLQGKPRLFCAPDNLSLDARTVWTLANGVLTGPHKADIIAVAVIDQLAERFPCEPRSKEEVELERTKEVLQMIDMLRTTVEQQTKERYAECLRATSSTSFCDCLNEKLGWQVSFSAYERVANSTKSQLGYASLSADERELVDHMHSIRDECSRFRRSHR